MTKDLSDLFSESQTNIVGWNGLPLYGLYEFKMVPSRFVVTFVSAREEPTQGLHLKIRGGKLAVGGSEGSDVALWRDSAPDQIEVKVSQARGVNRSLKIWNVWRGQQSVTHGWLGDAAMRVEENREARTVDLCCSDGEGPPNFDDLIVRLEIDSK